MSFATTYDGGSYTDWSLPNNDLLVIVYNNVGSDFFATDMPWSSTRTSDNSNAYYLGSDGILHSDNSDSTTIGTYLVRSYTP